MRKSESVIFRCSKELKTALDRLDNKTDYILLLILKDFQNTKDSDYIKQVELESSINIIKKQGQIINSGNVYLNLCSKAKTYKQKELMKQSFINTLKAQKRLTTDEATINIIDDTIMAFETMTRKEQRGNKYGK